MTKNDVREFWKRSPLWKISSLFSFCVLGVSCGTHSVPKSLSLPSQSSYVSQASCRSKMELRLQSGENDLSFSAHSKFDLNGKKSSFRLFALSPVGTRIGQLDINSEERLWTDSKGSRSIDRDPLLRNWLNKKWWVEMGFLHALAVDDASMSLKLSDDREYWLAEGPERRIICRNNFRGLRRFCEIESNSLKGQINFTFLDCDKAIN